MFCVSVYLVALFFNNSIKGKISTDHAKFIVLVLFGAIGAITGFIFLAYYGYKVVWWAPLVLFVVSMVFQLVFSVMELLLGRLLINILGFIAIPVLGYLMFTTLPIN